MNTFTYTRISTSYVDMGQAPRILLLIRHLLSAEGTPVWNGWGGVKFGRQLSTTD